MNIVFFGSDHFAAVHLEALIHSKHKVVACVTQPDRPKGRGMHVLISPVKECAQKNALAVIQPVTLKGESVIKQISEFPADLYVVIAYGRFLPEILLNIPAHGAINVHASLLPKYRGAAPINWAIINGDKETGISIIRINQDMDAGDVVSEIKIAIDKYETAVTLREKMMKVGPGLLLNALDALADGRCPFRRQDHQKATFAPKLTKELGHVNWTKGAKQIFNCVRGLLPWPSAYTFYNGKLLKILEADVIDRNASAIPPGTVIAVDKEGIAVATGHKSLLLKKVHLQDAKPMTAHEFVVGHKVETGFQFG